MNTDTGRLYEIGEDILGKSPVLTSDMFMSVDRPLSQDEMAAALDVAKGQTVVEVSSEVAQRVKLGERELERRRRRNKAAKQARKRNR